MVAALLAAGATWFVLRDDSVDDLVTCETPSACAEELSGSDRRPLVPRDNDRFIFRFGDVSRSEERPRGTLVLYYTVGDQNLELLITDTSQPGVAQKPDDSELVSTPGGRRVRATDRFLSYWDGSYLYTLISPARLTLPPGSIDLIDLLR